MKIDHPETDYYDGVASSNLQAHFDLRGIARRNESDNRIGVFIYPPPPDFECKCDISLSNPFSLQIGNVESDCHDGASIECSFLSSRGINNLVRFSSSPPLIAPSGITYEGWDVERDFFKSLLTTFNPFPLPNYLCQQQWSKARALNLRNKSATCCAKIMCHQRNALLRSHIYTLLFSNVRVNKSVTIC